MKEIQEIVKAYNVACKENKQAALATVVLVEGSAYRKAGARMLITEDGELTGAISGGCLEGDALRKARLAMAQQQPMLVTYDTMDDDDAKLGVGLGCNGIIHILIEPLHQHDVSNPVNILKQALAERQRSVLVTVFSIADRKSVQPGTCLLITENEEISANNTDPGLQKLIKEDALSALQSGSSLTKIYGTSGEYTAFVEVLHPPVSLIIFGAGNDAIPLVQFSSILGWDSTVIDGRPAYAKPERFPGAKRVIVAKPEQVLSNIQIDDRTVLVLMTHNYNYEMALLAELSSSAIPYLGILGPKKKLNRLLAELEDSGKGLPEHMKQEIYSPVGLDIGSETSEEIALAIVAEIKAVLSNKNGQSLKDKAAPVYSNEPPLNYPN
jgi:xanthine/CO dehydrogenase XdhC/CoxF family maturation factor